jgi:hypothetical protein
MAKIPKAIREQYGEKYQIVTYEDRIELLPVADAPLAAVRTAAGELAETPMSEIEGDIDAQGEADAAGEKAER